MKVLILEDEHLAAERMAELVSRYDPSIEIAGILDSVKDAVLWLKSNPQPGLIFMDIQLADGLSFDIFSRVVVEAPVIFTTAYEEYAIRAFKVNSVDYLLKPIDFNELKVAIDKFRRQAKIRQETPFLPDEILQSVRKMLAKPVKTRFIIKVGDHLKSVEADEAIYFYSQEKITNLVTAEARIYIVDYSLDHLMEIIDNEKFFRTSRQNILNRDAIADIVVYSKNRLKIKLKMAGQEPIIVSRDKVGDFKRWLGE
jgi:two-component system, LytTR family, response regulator